MSLRLGFCGVGKWANKLATAFRECGAEIVAYDRQNRYAHRCKCGLEFSNHGQPGALLCANCTCQKFDSQCGSSAAGFGTWTPWRDQLADKSIDAIIAVAPPEISTEVALACAAA